MQNIKFKYEQDINGKKDLITKSIDLDYQSGSASTSDEMQEYNILNSIVVSYFDFMNRVGFDPVSIFLHTEKVFSQMKGEEQPEENLIAASDQLDYGSFVEQFNNSEEFRQKQFEIFQMYMSDDED